MYAYAVCLCTPVLAVCVRLFSQSVYICVVCVHLCGLSVCAYAACLCTPNSMQSFCTLVWPISICLCGLCARLCGLSMYAFATCLYTPVRPVCVHLFQPVFVTCTHVHLLHLVFVKTVICIYQIFLPIITKARS